MMIVESLSHAAAFTKRGSSRLCRVLQHSAGAMADEQCTIAVRTVVSGGSCGDLPWIPQPAALETIQGQLFLHLCKRDFGLQRFIGASKSSFHKMTFLERLRGLRSKASLAASSNAGGLFDEEGSARAKKKQRKDALDAAENGAAPATVQLQLPALATADGTEVPAILMLVKFSAQIAPAAVVELTPANLTYIKYAMLASAELEIVAARSRKNNVHWRGSRGRYIANRSDEMTGRMLQKSFKPTDESAAAMAACKDAAMTWVDVGSEVEVEVSGEED